MLNIFRYLKVSQKNLGCFADRQKIYADRRLRTTVLDDKQLIYTFKL